MTEAYKSFGIVKKAIVSETIDINVVNLWSFVGDDGRIDDAPYGGGPGMVLKIEPILRGIKTVKNIAQSGEGSQTIVINTNPQGKRFTQTDAEKLASFNHVILVAGRYQGVDERLSQFVDFEYSIGDFVLGGGDLAALSILDSVVRIIPGVIGDKGSLQDESFNKSLLGYPQFTRPESVHGLKVPEVLLSGDHDKVKKWRRKQRLGLTYKRRRDLFEDSELNAEDMVLLEQYIDEHDK